MQRCGLNTSCETRVILDFQFLWSAHPCSHKAPVPILLPLDSGELLIDSSKGNRLGLKGKAAPADRHISKWTNRRSAADEDPRGSKATNFTRRAFPKAIVVFTIPTQMNRSFSSFDVESVPYVGLWICHGGIGRTTPKEPYTNCQWKPCNGRPDSCGKPSVGEKVAHSCLTNSSSGPPRRIA